MRVARKSHILFKVMGKISGIDEDTNIAQESRSNSKGLLNRTTTSNKTALRDSEDTDNTQFAHLRKAKTGKLVTD